MANLPPPKPMPARQNIHELYSALLKKTKTLEDVQTLDSENTVALFMTTIAELAALEKRASQEKAEITEPLRTQLRSIERAYDELIRNVTGKMLYFDHKLRKLSQPLEPPKPGT